MKPRYVSVIGAAILALALASPVAAWSAVGVTITGDPGGPVVGTGEVLVPELLVSPALAEPPAGDLGPKFQVAYSFEGDVAVQDLYPFAPDGPVAYSASKGDLAGHPFAAGWHQAKPSILEMLVSWGLSPEANGSAGAPTGTNAAVVAALDAHDRVRPSLAQQPGSGVALDPRVGITVAVIVIGAAALAFLGLATRSPVGSRRTA